MSIAMERAGRDGIASTVVDDELAGNPLLVTAKGWSWTRGVLDTILSYAHISKNICKIYV